MPPPEGGAAATTAPVFAPVAGAVLVVGAGVEGRASGLALLRSGISIGMSTEIGRGWVSNSKGKPITPTSTSTAAPSSRWRARRRIASILSAGAAATLAFRPSLACGPRVRNLKNAMKFVSLMECSVSWKRRRRSGQSGARRQVPGPETRCSVLEHTTHCEERSEDDDSISGVRAIDGRLQGFHRRGVHAGQGIGARVLRLPAGQQIGRAGGARGGQIGEVPAVDQAARCARTSAPRPCRPSRRTRHGWSGRSPSRRGFPRAPRPHAGCAPRRAPAPARPARSGSAPAARPSRARCARPAP